MKHTPILALLILVAGCIGGDTAPEETETHYLSSSPFLVGCNNRTSVLERENCYVEVAYSRGAPQLCKDVGQTRLRNLCYHKLAVKVRDPVVCQKIKNDDWRYTDCVNSATAPAT